MIDAASEAAASAVVTSVITAIAAVAARLKGLFQNPAYRPGLLRLQGCGVLWGLVRVWFQARLVV